ncbi:MAG: ABC transporter permease [Chloroflexi bacterium]|nr:ABC transporter permease [Chloroflexota bacterium]MBV9897507.1 ABC transporter permease [Chloroflexota bacterium]
MTAYLLRRLLQMAPVLVLISIVSFSLTFVLPGDPALAILGEQNARDQQLYAQMRAQLGLDRPLPVQYLDWASHVLRGDLGTSTTSRQPVLLLIQQRMGPTLELGLFGFILAVVLGVSVGVASAVRPNSKLDVVGTLVAMAGASIPHFWLGLLLILTFALWLRWLPPSGYVPPTQDVIGNLRLMLLPTIAVGSGGAAVLMRQVRSAMLEVLGQEYITTARAKGLTAGAVTMRHAFKNALIPVVTVLGLQIALLIGGAVVTESIFSIPGVGRLAADSIFNRDFPVLQAIVLLVAISVLIANLITDFVYAWLDPRIRYG